MLVTVLVYLKVYIGSFAVSSLNATRNANTIANRLYINGTIGDVFTCEFNNSFKLAGTGVIFNNDDLVHRNFQCNT